MNPSILIDPKQKATVNRQGFGFWSMNSTGELSETGAVKGFSKLRIRCYTSTVKCYSLQIKTCSDIGKNGDLPDIEEGAGIQSDHHDSLKLLFTISRQRKQCKLFTFNTYLCVFDLSIYKEQHVEYWAKELFLYAIWLWHLIPVYAILRHIFLLNSYGSLATCSAINACWKALIENFWMQDKGETEVKRRHIGWFIFQMSWVLAPPLINSKFPYCGVEITAPKLLREIPVPLLMYCMLVIPSLTKFDLQLGASL